MTDIFLWDRQTGGITIVSTTSVGALATGGSSGASSVSISGDGRYVAFIDDATNLTTGLSGTENRSMAIDDVFVKDTQTGILKVVSTTAQGALTTYGGYDPSISGDVTYVTFSSSSAYVTGDTNFYRDIYVKNVLTGAIEEVSVSSTGQQGNGECNTPIISSDGNYIAFNSWSTNFAQNDTNGYSDGFRVGNPLSSTHLSIIGVAELADGSIIV